jgi:superfamily II DNA or RNA helicase
MTHEKLFPWQQQILDNIAHSKYFVISVPRGIGKTGYWFYLTYETHGNGD